MRIALVPLLALAATLGLAAQDTSSSPEVVRGGLQLPVELVRGIKAEKARPGDEVRLRMVEPVLVGKGVVLPEGAKLFGRVLNSAAAEKGNPSVLSIRVERLDLKEDSIPLQAYVTGWGARKFEETGAPCVPLQRMPERRRGDGGETVNTRTAKVDPCNPSGTFDPPAAAKKKQIFAVRDVAIYQDRTDGLTIMVSKKNIHLPSGTLLVITNVEPAEVASRK